MTVVKDMVKSDFKFSPECFKRLMEEATRDIADMTSGKPPDVYDYASAVAEAVGFISYDSGQDLLMSHKFIGSIKAILQRKTFEYIGQSDGHYNHFLITCSFMRPYLSWGTSIRGAFFAHSKDIPISEILSCTPGWATDIMFTNTDQIKAAFEGLVMLYDEHIANNIPVMTDITE